MGPNLCEVVNARKASLLGDDDPDEEIVTLKAHLATCPHCQIMIDEFRVLVGLVALADAAELDEAEEMLCQTYLASTREAFSTFLDAQFASFKTEVPVGLIEESFIGESVAPPHGSDLVLRVLDHLRGLASREDRMTRLRSAVNATVSQLVPFLLEKLDDIWEVVVPHGHNLGALPSTVRSSGSHSAVPITEDERMVRELIRLAGKLNGASRRELVDAAGLCDDVDLSREAQELLFRKILSPTDDNGK